MTDVADPAVGPVDPLVPTFLPGGSDRGRHGALPWEDRQPLIGLRRDLLPHPDFGPDAGSLATRIDALAQFRRVITPYLPPERLRPVRALTERARQRLTICPELTVVALAGPTGSGKSSIFNALAGQALSPVGVRRPTTGAAYACVWGSLSEAAPLLDWLQVSRERRFVRESALDGNDQAGLHGLVLLDLPDFDSVEREHAAEVERLLGLVDLVVWVLDPQKYADQVVHERYLRRFGRHRDVTLVALNQADLLRADDAARLLDDLRKLLAADGLDGVTTMASSAVDLPAGLAQLQGQLRQVVSGRRAAWQRLAADVDRVVDDLADVVGPPVTPDTADRAAFGELADGLAEAAGVPQLAEAAEISYRERATLALSSPLLRWWVRRRRPPSWAESRTGPNEAHTVATGLAVRVAVRLAVRTVAARAAENLPAPWPEAIWRASRSRLPEIPDALATALGAGSERDVDQVPRWWRLVAVAQWLALVVALFGSSWLVVSLAMRVLSLPVSDPAVGPVPVPLLLLGGGVAAGGVMAVLIHPVLRLASRGARVGARRELRAAVAEVGRERVVAPVREVLEAYAEARAALHTAAGL